jgi:hypothetical protein
MQNDERLHGSDVTVVGASLPDPSGPPQPVDPTESALAGLTGLGIVLVACGSIFVLTGLSAGPTCGATRSSKLEWENRTAQIEQALVREEAYRQRPAEGPELKAGSVR